MSQLHDAAYGPVSFDRSSREAGPGWDLDDQIDASCNYQEINERRERLENAEALRLARAL